MFLLKEPLQETPLFLFKVNLNESHTNVINNSINIRFLIHYCRNNPWFISVITEYSSNSSDNR